MDRNVASQRALLREFRGIMLGYIVSRDLARRCSDLFKLKPHRVFPAGHLSEAAVGLSPGPLALNG